MDIDYALMWNFVDVDGRPRQLRFRHDSADAADVSAGTGQLIAIIADPQRADRGDAVAISRPGVAFADVENVLDGWQSWAMIGANTVNLAEIRRRINAAGLS